MKSKVRYGWWLLDEGGMEEVEDGWREQRLGNGQWVVVVVAGVHLNSSDSAQRDECGGGQ